MSDGHKILILRLSSLGDIIHTLPAFHGLRAAFPDARIDWLVERRLAYFLGAVEGIDRIIPIDTGALRKAPWRASSWRLLLDPVGGVRRTRYDIAIDFQGLLKTAFLSLASGAAARIGFSKELVRERPSHWFYNRWVRPPMVPIHIARLNLLLAQAAGAGQDFVVPKIRAGNGDVAAIEDRLFRERLSRFVVINPGGGWPTKRWLPARYGELAARIQSKLGLAVVITTGPGEDSLYQDIAGISTGPPPIHFAIPFLQLIPLFCKAQLVIGGDTGPLHLACALGIPVVSIMGPTAPVRNGPWTGEDGVVVHRLPCSFCNGRSCSTRNECMDIPVEEVYAAVVQRLEKNL
jgi:lipopolysaccharide heptosyltransferase I